ncbi:acyl carrier protein [Polymorphospora lycopeni]|uniref:Acyl carrier protein n=1 Tax=Polymorphospora lycopeni TaxID=3140240 RepID=A0ABV5CQP4_9ACTN
MTDRDVTEQIHQVIEDELRWPIPEEGLTDATRIGADGLDLDSVMLIELAVRLEQRFGFTIPDHEMFELAERSIGEVAGYVTARLATNSVANQAT